MTIGNNIRKIREIKGLTVEFMAKKLGIFKDIYINIEKNLITPNKELLIKIGNIFELTDKDIENFDEQKSIALKKSLDLKNLNISSIKGNKLVDRTYIKKPILIKTEDLNQINVVETNKTPIIEQQISDPLGGLIVNEGKPFSSRIVNWVEPYEISGINKTLFYTEVNTGLKVGDRVFIINGNYDSDTLIKADKYKKGRDGYKVIFVDKCRIVLDIDYTGSLPYNNEEDDNFINIYYIRSLSDFTHANRHITTRGGNFDYKFNPYQNNIIYSDQDYGIIQGWGETLGLTGSPGFYIKNGTSSWTNITSAFVTGSFSTALSPTYSNNNRIKIHNGTFTYSIGYSTVEFKDGFVYKWDMAPENDAISGTYSLWKADPTYNIPIISKGNFRDGNFTGKWNTGLYGRQDKEIKWTGEGTWRAGTILNTIWESGLFDSKYSLPESYVTEFDSNGIPFQKSNGYDNNGRSYNFIIDSELTSSTINNANVIGGVVGSTSTYSLVESHILSNTINYDNIVNKAYFENCKFIGGYINNSEIKNSRVVNTKIENSKSINTNYKLSVIKDSSYNSDDSIKILDYDEFNISEDIVNTASHKVYKFYISRLDYEKLKIRDRFYIKGLKFLDNNKYPINFFDKRFRLSTWTEYDDNYNTSTDTFEKRGIVVGVFLSTPGENEWKFNSIYDGVDYYTAAIEQNSKKNYSVDIIVSIYDKTSNLVNGLDFNTDQTVSGTSSPTMSNTLGNIIDVSSAYILNSDFESGIFETSNWNSGYHINYNNDVNITENTTEGGYYNLLVSTSSITATTLYDINNIEVGEECLQPGTVVFLNSVDYDTTGKVDSIIISASGTSYSTATGLTVSGGSGADFTLNITTDTIGTVLSITLSNPGTGIYYTASSTYTSESTIGGLGIGATVDFTTDGGGFVISASISNGGVGYIIGNTFSFGIGDAIAQVVNITNGEVLSATISNGGIGYQIGDILTIQSGDFNATINVLSTTGSITRLPDTYIIASGSIAPNLILEEVGTSVIPTLLSGGISYTRDAKNRWGYIHKAKIDRSNIKSGLFRRAYIKNSIIEDNDYDVTDKDFVDLSKIKNMLISDTLFTDNSNVLSKAIYMNSSIVNGSDLFKNGIVYNSIWVGSTFSNGTFKESRWESGTLQSGTFYNSRTFDATPSINHPYYYNENTKSYYKNGITSATISNNRYSWQSGQFNGGEFYKSDWESGIFNGGEFYYSRFYGGTISGGFIGNNKTPIESTLVYNGFIKNTTVNGAQFYAKDTSLYSDVNQNIDWLYGVFNSGIFGTDMSQTASNTATWSNGIFNGGQFVSNAKWKSGTFNGGKFLTAYGWTLSGSSLIDDYGWESGKFNGGEFGNANTGTNSTWYSGEFNGGVFKGRWWNNGIFTSGEFQGSSTYSAVGGYNVDAMTTSNAYNFVESYTQSYYGLWNTGYFTNIKDKFIKDEKIYTIKERALSRIGLKSATFKNALWISGTFSHSSGEFNNSVWLDGGFEAGAFKSSSFNPWVKRLGATAKSFNTNDDLSTGSGSCVWYSGRFEDSDFYISQWNNGVWISGTAFGMIWKDGITNYMNAYNIFWENGTWRNGNWQGSYFDFDGNVDEEFNKQILFRGMSWSGTSSCHTWNIFKGENGINDTVVDNVDAATTSSIIPTNGWKSDGYGFLSFNTFWDYNGTSGISRDTGSPLIEANLYQQSFTDFLGTTNHTFKSNKNYQFITSVDNFAREESFTYSKYLKLTTSFGSTFSYATNSHYALDTRPVSGSTVDINFYSSPSSTTTANYTVRYQSTYNGFGNPASDANGKPEITNFKLVEFDWFLQGYALCDDSRYSGWVYDDSNNSLKWRISKVGSVQGATMTISATGTGYTPGYYSSVELPSITGYGEGLIIDYTVLPSGSVGTFSLLGGGSADILRGEGYYTGDIVGIPGGNNDAYLTITSALGSGDRRFSVGGHKFSNYAARYVNYPKFNFSMDISFSLGSTYIDLYLIDTLPNSSPGSFTLSNGQFLGRISEDGNYNFYDLVGEKYILFNGNYYLDGQSSCITIIDNITIDGSYQETDNNEQFLFTNTDSYYEPTPLSLIGGSSDATYSVAIANELTLHSTQSIFFGATGDPGFFSTLYGDVINLNALYSKVGNGTFRAGVWENGVWNSGWRVDEEVYEFDDVEISLQMETKNSKWRIQIKGPQTSTSKFNVGDRVSIGNIVGIDINENRKLMKNYFTILSVNETNIVVEFTNVFPLRRIEKDSENHKIKITKNVWLNGGFLNGYFEGVWNNGLFKGFPYITEMYNTHWIDGTFDGGHYYAEYPEYQFIDTYWYQATSPYTLGLTFGATAHGFAVGDLVYIDKDDKSLNPQYDGNATVIEVVDEYMIVIDKSFGLSSTMEGGKVKRRTGTGVIQNFKFYDNNVATKTTTDSDLSSSGALEQIYKYNSWVDVLYSTQSASNLGRSLVTYDPTFGQITENNLYGYITRDVLSSESSFRNSHNLSKSIYSLGTKYKIYEDFLGEISEFNEPFGTNLSYGGLDNFYNNGWTYSMPQPSIFYGTSSDITRLPDESMQVGLTDSASVFVLDNNNITISKNRYSILEFDLIRYESTGDTFGSLPRLFLLNNTKDSDNNQLFPILNFVYHMNTLETKKYEYFFNRRELNIALLNQGGMTASFDNIKFYEIDMIPFFQYTTEDYVNKSIQVPYQGIAPFIDYTNNNFSFIDNITFGLDSVYTEQTSGTIDSGGGGSVISGGIFPIFKF